MKKRHMFIALGNQDTRFSTSDKHFGSNPAKTLEDHLKNIAEFLNGYVSDSVEFRLDMDRKIVKVLTNK